MAPHVIRPLRFMLPPVPGLRSALLLRLGLFVYDMLGGRKLLPATRNVDLTHHPVGQPLKRSFRYGFEYLRLPGRRCPAGRAQRARCRRARRRHPHPHAAACAPSGATNGNWCSMRAAAARSTTARVLVNAAGPWIGEVADTVIRRPLPAPVRLVKGSHIVVRAALRARLRLSVAGRRRARGVRAAVRAGVHVDRHNRREFRRRSQFAGARPGRDPLSVRHGE